MATNFRKKCGNRKTVYVRGNKVSIVRIKFSLDSCAAPLVIKRPHEMTNEQQNTKWKSLGIKINRNLLILVPTIYVEYQTVLVAQISISHTNEFC